MFVLGTAGHVDHGKSSLLRLLTGLEPDRLPEEKRRAMTIDLNFVSLALKSGKRIGIVDVPGHHRFVKNMASGVSAMDAFLFVVAADDGWMPQSEEHLQVLKGLGVRRGIGIVSKTDLVPPVRALEVQRQLQEKLEGAFTEKSPVVLFSIHSEESLKEVKDEVQNLVTSLPAPLDRRNARLWVDRVFVPKGLGVIVTGTLREGALREGDTVTLVTSGKTAVVKSLQCYHHSVSVAEPVSRLAIQLSKISKEDVDRGALIESKPMSQLVLQCDAKVTWFNPVKTPMRSVQCTVHVGTGNFVATLIPLNKEGERFARFKFTAAVPLRAGEPFMIRSSGDERLLGFAVVIDLEPTKGAHKLSCQWLSHWSDSEKGFTEFLWEKQSVVQRHLFQASIYGTSVDSLRKMAEWWVDPTQAFAVKREPLEQWKNELRRQKEKLSFSQIEAIWKSKFEAPKAKASQVLPLWIQALGLKREGESFRNPFAEVARSPSEVLAEKKILDSLSGELNPANLAVLLEKKEFRQTLANLVKAGSVVSLGNDHYLSRQRYEALCQKVTGYLQKKGQATTSELRDELSLSRKHVVLFLEHMDSDRITYLKDGVRKLLRP